jgi:NhaP-type Na+/H+ or K+/H+ antiporter
VLDLLTVAVIVLAYGFVSKPLAARGITSALALTVCGFVAGTSVLGLIDLELESSTSMRLAEGALVLLLFSDAARIDLRSLRRHLAWPSRLLLIGMPLTMLAATGVGALVLPSVTVLTAFLLATMVSATDAALGQIVVTDTRVPARVRQALDVESGLNDGLAVPFFLVAVDLSRAELTTGITWAVASNIAQQIGWGLVAGLIAGGLSGVALRFAARRGLVERQWRQVIPLAAAASAYLIASQLGGSGFIAAFVGGMAYGHLAQRRGHGTTFVTEEAGELLAAITWIGFGALALGHALPLVTWHTVLYAALCLTLVRMVPVAIALARQGLQRPTTAFMGWFGPRGLASIVFVLLALEDGVPDADALLSTVALTVALSVLAHGITSVPLVARYTAWYATRAEEHPETAEAVPATMSRLRRQRVTVEPDADGS